MTDKEGTKIDSKKNVIIVILVAFCMLLMAVLIYLLFGGKSMSGSSKFLQSTYTLQNKISLYIGQSTSDTFGVYTNEEIVTGKLSSSGEEIKDNEDKALKPLVNIDEKVDENGKIAYKINDENLKSLLNTSMPDYDGVEFYVQDGELIKVKLTSKPDWWNDDLDFLLVGND